MIKLRKCALLLAVMFVFFAMVAPPQASADFSTAVIVDDGVGGGTSGAHQTGVVSHFFLTRSSEGGVALHVIFGLDPNDGNHPTGLLTEHVVYWRHTSDGESGWKNSPDIGPSVIYAKLGNPLCAEECHPATAMKLMWTAVNSKGAEHAFPATRIVTGHANPVNVNSQQLLL